MARCAAGTGSSAACAHRAAGAWGQGRAAGLQGQGGREAGDRGQPHAAAGGALYVYVGGWVEGGFGRFNARSFYQVYRQPFPCPQAALVVFTL